MIRLCLSKKKLTCLSIWLKMSVMSCGCPLRMSSHPGVPVTFFGRARMNWKMESLMISVIITGYLNSSPSQFRRRVNVSDDEQTARIVHCDILDQVLFAVVLELFESVFVGGDEQGSGHISDIFLAMAAVNVVDHLVDHVVIHVVNVHHRLKLTKLSGGKMNWFQNFQEKNTVSIFSEYIKTENSLPI